MSQLPIFDNIVDDLLAQVDDLCQQIASLPLEQQVHALNRIRERLHQVSPFDDPIDAVYWVKAEQVHPNDYNPNFVFKPEMQLLKVSMEKHVTQPVVTSRLGEDDFRISDGEHRFITATTSPKLKRRLHGYVPVTVTKSTTLAEHMADTVEHNRARGVHQLDGMTNIVLTMLREGWTDDQVAKQLGMDADEVLRMKQICGAAEAFKRPFYKRAWVNDDGQDEVDAP